MIQFRDYGNGGWSLLRKHKNGVPSVTDKHEKHQFSCFQTSAMFWVLCAFFWVIPRSLNSDARRRGITQKKVYNNNSFFMFFDGAYGLDWAGPG